MEQEPLAETRPAGNNVYAFNGQMLAVAAIATVFFFVFLLVSLHLYARWWLRRAAASRRRTHVVVLSDPGSSADGGLNPAVLSSLPVFAFSSKTPASPAPERALLECAVCLSEFEEDETVRLLPRCNHAFHIECIDMWFHSHTTCPLCRSPVEPAAEPAVGGTEPGSSSGCDLCATCQHVERSGGGENAAASYGSTASFRRRKAMDVRIDVGPAEFESELTQGSPVTRLLSFKRLVSMRMKSPVGGRASPRSVAGTSRAGAELDLEGGLGEPVRVRTPK